MSRTRYLREEGEGRGEGGKKKREGLDRVTIPTQRSSYSSFLFLYYVVLFSVILFCIRFLPLSLLSLSHILMFAVGPQHIVHKENVVCVTIIKPVISDGFAILCEDATRVELFRVAKGRVAELVGVAHALTQSTQEKLWFARALREERRRRENEKRKRAKKGIEGESEETEA